MVDSLKKLPFVSPEGAAKSDGLRWGHRTDPKIQYQWPQMRTSEVEQVCENQKAVQT